jgi:predicted RNA-binding Zn-ribbon protein involved in translation (DUF1610 family)
MRLPTKNEMTEYETAILSGLSQQAKAVFRKNLRALDKLVAKRMSFPAFLDAYLQCVMEIYAATAAAIWVREQDGANLHLQAQINFPALGLEGELEAQHMKLLRYALQRSPPDPFLVRPYSAAAARAQATNPTDSFVVLGPVDNRGDVVALVELFLGPKPARARTARDQDSYVVLLKRLIWLLCRRVERELDRDVGPVQALTRAAGQIAACRQEIELHQAAVRRSIENTVRGLAGLNCGSFEANRAVAKSVQQLLAESGLRVACPDCGQPAILRCQRAGNAKTGVFQFDHVVAGRRTFHGGSTSFPLVTVTPSPPRRRTNAASRDT